MGLKGTRSFVCLIYIHTPNFVCILLEYDFIYIYKIHNSWGDWSLGKTFYGLSFHLLASLALMDLFIYVYFLKNDLFLEIWLGFENEWEKFCCLTYHKSLTFLAISNLYINNFHSQTHTNIYTPKKMSFRILERESIKMAWKTTMWGKSSWEVDEV